MVELDFLLKFIDPITLGICLCVGFALKYAKLFERFGNQYIPLSMLILGFLIGIVTHIGNISAEIVLGGMISGLASTGLYETVRNLLKHDGKSEVKENE